VEQHGSGQQRLGNGGGITDFQNKTGGSQRRFNNPSEKRLCIGVESIGVFQHNPINLAGFYLPLSGCLDAVPILAQCRILGAPEPDPYGAETET
jgi:hypothetical protein